jgi:hypothetical protein
VFSPPTIQPAGDDTSTASMGAGRISLHSAIFDDMFNRVSSPRGKASAVALGVGVLGAGAVAAYRIPKLTSPPAKPTTLVDTRLQPLSITKRPPVDRKVLRPPPTGVGKPPSPPASTLQTGKGQAGLARLVAPMSAGDKLRTQVMGRIDRLPERTRDTVGVVLGGGALVLGAQLGRMVVSRLILSKGKSSAKTKEEPRSVAMHTSPRRIWGSSFLNPSLNKDSRRRRRGLMF